MDDEAREAIRTLRLKLKGARNLIRDLHQWAAEVERQLDRLESQSRKEAEREYRDEVNEVCVA
jgi:hypothetical protein